uniref:Probable transcriptional autoregulator n=1 Tax=uncultured virus TaxID=340016 RepID=D5L2I7_9VIRU|nr:probable transcriptional autoregulator [uncultured virus]
MRDIPDSAIADTSLTGNLIDIREFRAGDYKTPQLRLIACPLDDCEYELERWDNTRTSISDHLLHDHNPEDFGLEPLRELATPETVVISSDPTSQIYHTRECGPMTFSQGKNLSTVSIDDLDERYTWCKKCKGRPMNIEEITTHE